MSTLRLAPGLALQAALDDGLIMSDRAGELVLIEWGPTHERPLLRTGKVLAQHGSLVAVTDRQRALTLLNVATGTQIDVQLPCPGRWEMFGSFSPDGRTLALGIQADRFVDPDAPQEMVLESWRWPSRLALVDAQTGTASIAHGSFINFAPAPVWSGDSSWL